MFDNKTADALLEELLNLVPEDTNKSEGSLIHTTLAAIAEKMEQIYIDMEENIDNMFADTADREHLIKRAAERGLKPYPATSGEYLAHFNCAIDLGDRFAIDDYTFIVAKKIESDKFENVYHLICEQTGIETNELIGELDYIEGENENFESGYTFELIVPGQDEQETEDFREAYFDNAENASYAGNVQSYIESANKIKGVGASKVKSVENGIRMVFVDDEFNIPSENLIDNVQNTIDPSTDVNNWGKEYGLPELEDYSGMGYGLAPIDHSVLCESATPIEINVTSTVTLSTGHTIESIREEATKVIEDYLKSLRKKWKNAAVTTVRRSHIEAALIKVTGIDDVTNTEVNNLLKTVLNYDEIPILKSVTLTESEE